MQSCGLCSLNDHRLILDQLYQNIVSVLCDAAGGTSEKRCKKPNRSKHLCGWNEHVRDAHRVARLNFQTWILYRRPTSGTIYDRMYESRKIFISRLKWCQSSQEQLKMDILAKHRSSKNVGKFWKATGKCDVKPGR